MSEVSDVKGEATGMSYEACNVVGAISVNGTDGMWKRRKSELIFFYGLTINGGGSSS